MGQPISELDLEDGGRSGPTLVLKSVPKPSDELEVYAVVAHPDTGICEIRAVSKQFESDQYGNNVRTAMDQLADALDTKYGKHKKLNYCGAGATCEFFQMNLENGSQAYLYEWSKASGAHLDPSLERVSMIAMPGQFNSTFFRLDYRSSDSKACTAAAKKDKAAAL